MRKSIAMAVQQILHVKNVRQSGRDFCQIADFKSSSYAQFVSCSHAIAFTVIGAKKHGIGVTVFAKEYGVKRDDNFKSVSDVSLKSKESGKNLEQAFLNFWIVKSEQQMSLAD
jgi:hypothetical protein